MIKRMVFATALIALLLPGCSGIGDSMPAAPATPDVADITTQQTAINAFTGTPDDLLNIGVGLSNRWCNDYLNALTRNVSVTDFEASTATQLGTLGSGIAGAVGAGSATTTIMAVLFPTLNQELTAAGRMATAGTDPGVVYTLVAKSHSAYLGSISAPASLTEAVAALSDYSAICQPAAIRSAVLQSGLNASATSSGGSSAKSLSAGPPRGLHVPPVITLGQ